MGLRRNLLIGVLLCGVALPASGQVTFRQRGFDATIPDFGGYTPNGGGRLPSSNRGGPIRFPQGSFDTGLSPFKSYTSNRSGRSGFSTRGPATLRQGGAGTGLPSFGLLDPQAAARLQFAKQKGVGRDVGRAPDQPHQGDEVNDEADSGKVPPGQLPANLPLTRRFGRGGVGANRVAPNLVPAAPIVQPKPRVGDQVDAEKPSANVRELRRQKAIDRLVKAAQSAEVAGRIAQAKMYYRMAIKRSPKELQSELMQRLQELE